MGVIALAIYRLEIEDEKTIFVFAAQHRREEYYLQPRNSSRLTLMPYREF
jgi:hypothetical protein